MRSFEEISPDFALTSLQKAAIRQIYALQEELAERGMYVRTGMELEFMVEDQFGALQRNALDLEGVNRLLKQPGMRLPLLEGVRQDVTSEYEVSAGDTFDPRIPINPRLFSPVDVSQTINHLKTKAIRDVLLQSSSLTPAVRFRLISPVFRARPYIGSDKEESYHAENKTSALHVNVSLYDAKGNNLFHANPKLMKHCAASLVDLQDEAGLALLPSKHSLRRFDEGMHAAVPAGIGMERVPDNATRRYHSSVALRGGVYDNVEKQKHEVSDGHDVRIENRLPGADADPFVAMAVTLAALVNVTRDMDSINDGLPYQKYSLPELHSEMITRFSRSSYARELLGDELYEGILEKYGKTQKRER